MSVKNEKLRIGLLSFAHMHATSYADVLSRRDDVEIVGIWDSDTERAAEMSRKYGSTSFSELNRLLDLRLDGAIVACENIYHRLLVESCADAKVKTVLCEKPLATTVEDAAAMVSRCVSAGTVLVTAFPCRHSPPFRRLLEQVKSGVIGDVLAIRGTNRGSMPGGWFIDNALSGGGSILDHTVHVADLIWLLLGEEAENVYAESGDGFHKKDVDDAGLLTITYPSGIFATLDTSWSRPKTYPTWGDVNLQVVGTGGVLDLDLFGQSLEHYNDASQRVSWDYWGSSPDGSLIAEFLRLCAGEPAEAIATGSDGVRALALATAAYESVKAHQPVRLGQ